MSSRVRIVNSEDWREALTRRAQQPLLLGVAAGRQIRRMLANLLWALLLGAGVGLVLWGVGLIYPPAAVIGAGLAVVAAVTFDPAKRGRLQWPR